MAQFLPSSPQVMIADRRAGAPTQAASAAVLQARARGARFGRQQLVVWKGARSHRLYGLVRAASSALDARVAMRRPRRAHDRFVVVLNCFGQAPERVAREVRRVREEAPPETPVLVGVDEEAAAVDAAYGAGATDTLGSVVAANPGAVRTHIATGLRLLQADPVAPGPPAADPLDTVLGGMPSAASNTADETGDVPWAFAGRKRPRGPAAADEQAARALIERATAAGDLGEAPAAGRAGLDWLAPDDWALLLAVPDDRDLRAPGGAYDANAVAAALGVRRSQLAPALGVTPQALSKTPASPRAQPGLAAVARVLRAARAVVGPGAVAAWLRTPVRRFGAATLLDLVLRGDATALADELEGVAGGIPD